MNRAFSLVELSIVLVILGLLTGGILAGQSLIHAAELRAVTSEYQRYSAASQTFREKYLSVAGDFSNATRFWGTQTTAGAAPVQCITNSGSPVNASGNGTCDGNGDGYLHWWAVSRTAEVFQFWRQLALAGLIEGQYTGITGSGGYSDSIVGTNIPASRYPNSAWSLMTHAPSGGLNNWVSANMNTLLFGGAASPGWATNPTLSAADAWNIDTKMDDGKPGLGMVLGAASGGCVTTAVPATAEYRLLTNPACFIEFTAGF